MADKFITRQKHDELLKKNVAKHKDNFVNAIMYMKKYRHTYSIAGITYYNIKNEDLNVLD